MNNGKVIAVAGNQSTCADVLKAVCEAGYEVAYLVHMDEEHAHHIADYQDLVPLAKKYGVRVVRPATYAMDDAKTRMTFDDLHIDLLISAGWQRLFPGWFLDSLSIGAFGMHGSAEPLPKGRGRSPMNWSIIEGRDRFYTSLFKYDVGIDSGAVVGTQRFDITDRDSIQSLRHKNTMSQIKLVLDYLPDMLSGSLEMISQPDEEPTYYPKRTPEDGVVDWRESVLRVDRLVRAVSHPYPGAYTHLGGQRINIWGGLPFDSHLRFDEQEAGEVVKVFHDNSFVVRCGDAAYYINDWESPDGVTPVQGDILDSGINQSLNKLAKMYRGIEQPGYGFTYAQYGDLLDAFQRGGYAYGFFDEEFGNSRTVFLRHDVDKSPHKALEMAHMEHDRGVRSTYYFLIRGALYNFLETETADVVRQIARLGHKIGLHCDLGRVPGEQSDIDEVVLSELDVFAKVCPVSASRMVTFHNPPADVVGRVPATDGYLSGYDPRFMLPETKYVSESNAHWREGLPLDMIASGQWNRLQVLVHPMWWMWDVPRSTADILTGILADRAQEQDRYLQASNHLWQQWTQTMERER